MNIQTKATNVTLTPDIQGYLDKRIQAIQKLVDPNDTSVRCQVELEKTTEHHKRGDIYRSEINLHMAGASFRADATAERLLDAIDESKAQMMKELRRHKDKKSSNVRRGGAKLKDFVRRIRG